MSDPNAGRREFESSTAGPHGIVWFRQHMDKRIEVLKHKIVEFGHPDKIILFGSHARGTATDDSDVDLLVIGPSDLPQRQRQVRFRKALFGSGVPYDLIALTPEEVELRLQRNGPFIREILSTGKVIYERS
jgi:predicted nucleotidyltransferase